MNQPRMNVVSYDNPAQAGANNIGSFGSLQRQSVGQMRNSIVANESNNTSNSQFL